MAERRPTHILSSYFAPRGHNRMYSLGMQLAQQYLSPNDKFIGIIGEAGSGKSALIRGMFPGLELTMNIAGSVKTTPLIERGFCVGLEMLDSRLPQEKILFREIRMLPTGCEANYAISIPASKLKLLYIGLPHFQQFLADGFSENDAGAYTLLHLIANVADTNLCKRGGKAGAQWAAKAARELLSATKYPSIQQIEVLDDGFIARTLSPGGCADLLAATCFLQKLAQ